VRILLWHVHGSWTTALVQGSHTYLLPVLPDRGPDGRGRAQTWDWPGAVVEVTPEQARRTDIDVVIAQRPEELHRLVGEWTGRVPGREVPCLYVEHNTPDGPVESMRHPAADWPGLTVVHVTHFNRLFWDTRATPTRVIEHGIVDPGYRYRGDVEAAAVVVNHPQHRWRVTGFDLLAALGRQVDIDVFGMGTESFGGRDLPQSVLHDEMARRRVYLHPIRWTSLGLSLIEAMHLGMPVVALATTEATEAIPAEAGVVSNRLDVLEAALGRLVADPEEAAERGRAGRQAALNRYGLKRFLEEWDDAFEEVRR
jgi:glycosyltransferase involved in cell wall biosynthesis